jgi:diguanylate cyclase (GGDEF)-like protein/PAS domain S-box-containing protein
MEAVAAYSKFLETIPDAAVLVDTSGIMIVVNRNAARLFHYPISELSNQPLNILLPVALRGAHQQHLQQFFAHPAQRQMGQGLDLTGLRADGEVFALDIMISQILLDEQRYAVAIIRDQTARQQAEQRVRMELEEQRQQAQTDSLTGLPNRRAFATALDNHLIQLERRHTSFSLAYLDLDNFKAVNDADGHLAGDQLLKKFGQYLNHLCRSRDLIARIGGDEFAIILADSTQRQTFAALQRICDQMVELFQREGWPVTVSIGWIYCDKKMPVMSSAELMMRADKAMYQAKRDGKNKISRGEV